MTAPVDGSGTSVATGTILDPNATPGFSVGNASANEGSPETFTVTLTNASTSAIKFSYATANGTGTAGINYTAASGAVTIPAGQLTGTITVNTLAGANPMASKTFYLNVTATSGTTTTGAQGVGTILNTVLPKIYINSVSLLAGNSGTREMYFSICLSDPAPFPVSFNYATSDGTAVAGKDYTAKSGSFTFAAGLDSQPMGVPIFGSTTYAANKTFTVTLSSPVNATILTPTSTGTIISSAAPPTQSLEKVTVVQPDSAPGTGPSHHSS